MLRTSERKKGFTLVEMLTAMAIVAVLAMVAIPLAKVTVKRGREIELRRNLRIIRQAIDEYKKMADEKKFEFDEDTEGYPPDLETLLEGVEVTESKDGSEVTRTVKFLRRLPRDPMTTFYEWGLRSYQDDFDSTSWGGENVYDVYTRSQGIALDGTFYSEW
ncbi:MAG: type II secretion system protein [Candidatus Aminicenantaceae bacterium]